MEGKNYNIIKFNLLTSLLALLNLNDENDTDFVIARYFLLHLNEIKNISIYKVAEECYVSRSSIQRFIKKIGYNSFTSMKNSMDEVLRHEEGFIDYTDHTDYRSFISSSIADMIADIEKASKSVSFKKLLNIFLSAKTIVILTAEDSSHACKVFQQQFLTFGKLVRILSSASTNISILDTLDEKDLLMVCSVTGNYALAISDNLQAVKAKKVLITLNHTTFFEPYYSFIYYLGNNANMSSRYIVSSRNVYNNYGLAFFFDLFYHECFLAYQKHRNKQ